MKAKRRPRARREPRMAPRTDGRLTGVPRLDARQTPRAARPRNGRATDVAGESASGATPKPSGLLAIFAHPDDESYGAGGVMALAAAAGNPVWVLCATNGD